MNICHENCQDICQAIAFGEDGVLATDESLWYKFDATGYTGSFRQFHGCYSAECCNAFFDIGNDATGSDHIAILELHASSASKNQSTLPTWSEASWHEASPGKHIRTAVWNNSPLSRISTETVPLIYVKENEMALKPFPPGVFEGFRMHCWSRTPFLKPSCGRQPPAGGLECIAGRGHHSWILDVNLITCGS